MHQPRHVAITRYEFHKKNMGLEEINPQDPILANLLTCCLADLPHLRHRFPAHRLKNKMIRAAIHIDPYMRSMQNLSV